MRFKVLMWDGSKDQQRAGGQISFRASPLDGHCVELGACRLWKDLGI